MRIIRHNSVPLFLGLVVLLCSFEWWIVTSAWFLHNPDVLSLAITVDLTLGVPLLYYLCLVRSRRSPAITLVPVFVISVGVAHVLLPAAQHTYLDHIENLLPFIEFSVLLFVLFKARAVVRVYRDVRLHVVYGSDALERSVRQIIGASPVIKLLVTELSLPYYVVAGWFKHFTPSHPSHVPFFYHRKTGYGAIIPLFIGLVSVETVVVHALIQQWSALVAWILTGLSVYSLVWLVGDYHASRLHPIVLSADHVYIRTGLRWRADVPLTKIEKVRKATRIEPPAPGYVNAAVYGEPRYFLYLIEPIIIHGLLGIQKQVTKIGFSVDDESLFEAELHQRMQNVAVA